MYIVQGEPDGSPCLLLKVMCGDETMKRLTRRARRRDRDAAPEPPEETLYDDYGDYEEAPIEPFVQVSGEFDEFDYGDVPETVTTYPEREPRRRAIRLPRPSVHLPTLSLGINIEWGYLLLALALIVAGIFGALLNRGQVPDNIEEWWPLAIVVAAAVWMVVALARRQVASFLGGSALAGVGLSLVMNNQDIADFRETLLGMVLVTAGLGIAIRGFLLRQQNPY
jgi:hypothetical protein